MYLLDTNVISEFRLGPKANFAVMAWGKSIPAAHLALSTITVMEIKIGIGLLARKDASRGTVLHKWFEHDVLQAFDGRIHAVDTAVALCCATLHVPLRRPAHDALIAATALVHGLTLVTRNAKDFEDTGVRLFDPWR